MIPPRPKLRHIPNSQPHGNIIDPAQARRLIPDRALAPSGCRARRRALGSRVHRRRGGPSAGGGREPADAARESIGVGVRGPLAYLARLAAPDVQVQPVGPAAGLAAVAGALAVAGARVRGEGLEGVERVAGPAFAA